MFRINQIMTATQFVRSFREVAAFLSHNPEPLLITQKNGRFIVVMDGEFFEGLMDGRAQLTQVQDQAHASNPSVFKS
jgi:PHD/YefM family antitoxin component YafN of YafNO toxin-antitoxin module